MKFPTLLIPLLISIFWQQQANAQIQPIEDSKVADIDDQTFDQLESGEWLFYIGAKWCSYCRHFGAEFDLLSRQIPTGKGLRLARADIDDSPGLASRFLVAFLPSVYYIKDRKVHVVDFNSETLKDAQLTKRDAETLLKIIDADLFADMKQWNSWTDPWSLFGKTLGLFGRLVAAVHLRFKAAVAMIPLSAENGVWIGIVVSVAVLTFVLFCAPRGSPSGEQGGKKSQ